jgi:hypothetical protein
MSTTSHRFAAALILFVCTGLPIPGHTAEPIRAAMAASPTGEVSIVVVRGRVNVIGIDGSEVRVEGTRDAASERFVFERDGETVRIEDRLPSRTPRGAGTQLTVEIPRGSRLRVQLVSADLSVADVSGSARLATVSGSVTARALGGEVEISTVSGSQSIEGASGEVRLDTVSGGVTARIAASRLAARTVSGALELENSEPLRRGRLASISGRVHLTTPLEPDVELELETVSGAGTLTLAGDLNVRLEAVGGPGGSVRNELTDTPVRKSGFGVGERLETRLGDGRGYVRASTVSGTLTLATP